MPRFSLPLVLFAGAAALAFLRGGQDVTFNITPLAVGVVALAAAATLPSPKPWTGGIMTTSWGVGVWLSRETFDLSSAREAPVFMVALGIGLLVSLAVAGARDAAAVARSAAAVMIVGGALFYLAFDVAELREWWVFAAGLAAAGVVETARLLPRRG